WPLPTMALLAHTLALLAMTTVTTVAINVVPLDTAPDSFDDQYINCGPAMIKVLPSLYNFETQKNPVFTLGWAKADAEWRKRGSHVAPLGSPAQAVAVMAYSMKYLYKQFNDAVRVAGRSPQEYRNNFHFKMLHFLLTQAVATLRQAQNGQCHQVFRGVHDIRFKAQKGQRIRFGQFTSTSPSKEVIQHYGTDTVFEIYTCYGADIQAFAYDHKNREVLIPPYETFEVTKVVRIGKKAKIQLRSIGTYSKYNCALL
ncbi:NRT2 ribosyltransferase, partial [Chloropsis hardwickii]|nr:NRT2 ribosyltransferase [Chloropsis hardwickii]